MALHHIPKPLLYQNSSYYYHSVPDCSSAVKFSLSGRKLHPLQNQVCVKVSGHGGVRFTCRARRRVRYVEEDEEGDEEYGDNLDIAMLEDYSERKTREALLVKATVDSEEEVVLIFKGFSSCLTATTATDPSKSVLPARAIIQSIDVIRGPFDPNNIEYLEKGLTWEAFKTRLQ